MCGRRTLGAHGPPTKADHAARNNSTPDRARTIELQRCAAAAGTHIGLELVSSCTARRRDRCPRRPPKARHARPKESHMEFGLFSNNRRPDSALGAAWDADIFEAEVADRLGFQEIWFSEHQSPA